MLLFHNIFLWLICFVNETWSYKVLWEYLLIDEPGFQWQNNMDMFDISAFTLCVFERGWGYPVQLVGMYRNGHRDFLTNHLFPIPLLPRVSAVPVYSLRIQPWLRRAQISCVEMWSKPQGASKLNRYPPPVMSFFLALNVQTSLMHIWNWFETHSADGWCWIEGEVTKKKHQITASDEEPGGLQKTCTKIK